MIRVQPFAATQRQWFRDRVECSAMGLEVLRYSFVIFHAACGRADSVVPLRAVQIGMICVHSAQSIVCLLPFSDLLFQGVR